MKIQDRLNVLNMVYGGNVAYTNGLYHIYNKDHTESYINNLTNEIDTRAVYNTIAVLDDTIVTRVFKEKDNPMYLILMKKDLKCVYKTHGNIEVLNNNLVCDYKNSMYYFNKKIKEPCTIVSNFGRVLCKLSNIDSIHHLHNNYYLVKSKEIFKDKVIKYNKQLDLLDNLIKQNRYIIDIIDIDEGLIRLTNMYGFRYEYSFKTRQVLNLLTGNIEKDTKLFL